jgi:hypothetical protein
MARKVFLVIILVLVFILLGSENKKDSSDFQSFRNQKEKLNPTSRSETSDLDNNSEKEEYVLEKGQLTISENGREIWASPQDWWVDNFILADSTNDGKKDINLSVWKSGDYGQSKPFWVKTNDPRIKNHFFVFDLNNGQVQPIWQSSNLDQPNCDFVISDADGDNKQDLVVMEGAYQEDWICTGAYLAVWKWNGWGFSNEWRSQKGHYPTINIEEIKTTP